MNGSMISHSSGNESHGTNRSYITSESAIRRKLKATAVIRQASSGVVQHIESAIHSLGNMSK